jgi:hypothetical protein
MRARGIAAFFGGWPTGNLTTDGVDSGFARDSMRFTIPGLIDRRPRRAHQRESVDFAH